ncbi:MAG: FtsX-like permease family protein [Spirochaetia bacterium]
MKNGPRTMLALRNIITATGGIQKQVRSALFGVALSIIPLIVVLQVSDGMIEGITSRFIELGTYHIQAVPIGSMTPEQIQGNINRIAETEGVRSVFQELQGIGLVYSENGRSGTTIRALPPDVYHQDASFQEYLDFQNGSFNIQQPNTAVIGTQIARALDVETGDSIRILTAKTMSGGRVIPRVTTVEITGVFSAGYRELDSLWTIINLEKGEQILRGTSYRRIIGIKTDSPFEGLDQVMINIRQRVSPVFSLYTWYELERSQYQSFQTTKNLLIFIMLLIVIVASVNISSTCYMMVLEKQDEIAILKTMGAKSKDITIIFMLSGIIIGAVGLFGGLILGLLLSVNINVIIHAIESGINAGSAFLYMLQTPFIEGQTQRLELFNPAYYLDEIPIKLDFLEVYLSSVFVLFISCTAAIFPAVKAGKITPIELLRKH